MHRLVDRRHALAALVRLALVVVRVVGTTLTGA